MSTDRSRNLEPGPGFGVGRGFAIRGPFPVQAPDKAPETCTWSTRSADRGSQVSALGVGLPSGTPFRCRHRIKHRKRAPGQRGLRVGANLQSRNLDGNQIAWKYRRCAGHANLLFRDGVKRQVGKCDCLLEFTTRPELSQSRAESGHNSMCQNGLKILLRAIVRHGPKTGDLPSVWLDTCGSLPTPMTSLGGLCLELLSGKGLESAFLEGIGLKHETVLCHHGAVVPKTPMETRTVPWLHRLRLPPRGHLPNRHNGEPSVLSRSRVRCVSFSPLKSGNKSNKPPASTVAGTGFAGHCNPSS